MTMASSASRTWGAAASALEWTATVAISIARAVRMMRRAISPRLAMRSLCMGARGLAAGGAAGYVYGMAVHHTSTHRTNVEIDIDLIARALALTGVASKREAIDLALRELVARREALRRQRVSLDALRGAITQWDGDLDAWRRD